MGTVLVVAEHLHGKFPKTTLVGLQAGKQAADEVSKQMPVLPDNDPLTQYVRSLGNKLVSYVPNSQDNPRFPYEFHVVNVKEINAFALPGGPIFVNVGTIQAADNEAAHKRILILRSARCSRPASVGR